MANRERGEVQVTIKGKAYTLRMSINALCELEAALSTPTQDVKFIDVLKKLQTNRATMREIRALFWSALREHQPTMTMEQAGELIQAIGLAGLSEALTAAIGVANPDQEDVAAAGGEAANPPRTRRRGAGVTSTSTLDASA